MDVCATVDSIPAGLIDRVGDIVITFNTVPGSAGTLLLSNVHMQVHHFQTCYLYIAIF